MSVAVIIRTKDMERPAEKSALFHRAKVSKIVAEMGLMQCMPCTALTFIVTFIVAQLG